MKKKETAHQVDEQVENDDDAFSIGRVQEIVRAVDDGKNKTADIELAVLYDGHQSKPLKVKLLIDSGVHKTLLSEEQWRQVQMDRRGSRPKLLKNKVRLVPYGTDKSLEVLGRAICTLTAAAGARVETVVYVLKNVKESLLGLKDGEDLGIIKIQPEGEQV